jgi:hypothetical protein
MKKSIKNIAAFGLIALAFMVFASCENMDTNSNQSTYTTVLEVMPDGTSSVLEADLKSVLDDEPVTLSSDEELLAHMKDEEKLARDVYNTLYTKWNVLIFSNIAKAEQKHLDAVMLMINTYTSLDLEEGEAGVYDDETFAILYTQLVAQGSESLEQAYTVGALIEELDIYDLVLYLNQTSNENIVLVFENLMRGSKNHLRAFNRNLVALGVSYEPQYIDQLTFDEIVNSAMEQGKRYKKHNGGGNGNGGNGNGGQGGSGGGNGNGH